MVKYSKKQQSATETKFTLFQGDPYFCESSTQHLTFDLASRRLLRIKRFWLGFMINHLKPLLCECRSFVVYLNIHMHKKYPKMSTINKIWMLLPYVSLFLMYKNDWFNSIVYFISFVSSSHILSQASNIDIKLL